MVEVRGSSVGVASLRGLSRRAGPGMSRKERRHGRKISQLRDGVVTSYTYDAADRLTGQQLAGAYGTYTMDSVGNITVKHQEGSSPMTMTYDAASRLTVVVQDSLRSTYTYDSNGNNTAINAGGVRTTLAYDYENRMRTYIEGANRTTYVYWADGLRRQQIVNGSAVTYVWDGSDYLQARGVSEVQTFESVSGQIVASDLGGVERLLVPDPLGSVVKLLDASGNELYDAAYWPYGAVQASIGASDVALGYVGTAGYYFDGPRRMYVRHRVVDPVTGRWYTVDPLWPNERAYNYAENLPCQALDFFGTSANGLPQGLQDLIFPKPRPNPKPIGPPNPGRWPWQPGWQPGDPLPFPTAGKPYTSPYRGTGCGYVLPYKFYDPNPHPFQFGYGNWCGHGRPGKGNIRGKPVDRLDSCCMEHDAALGENLFGGADGCAHCGLLRCAKQVHCSSSPYTMACIGARQEIIAMMDLLCKVEQSYDLRCIFV